MNTFDVYFIKSMHRYNRTVRMPAVRAAAGKCNWTVSGTVINNIYLFIFTMPGTDMRYAATGGQALALVDQLLFCEWAGADLDYNWSDGKMVYTTNGPVHIDALIASGNYDN